MWQPFVLAWPSYHLLASSHWPRDALTSVPICPREVNLDQWECFEPCDLKFTPQMNWSGLISPKWLFVNAQGCLIVKCWSLRRETPSINNMSEKYQIWVYPPFPRRVFGQGDFPLRGEGGTPNSVKENSAKKQIFLATEAQLGLIGLASPSSVGWRSSTTLSGSRLAINKNW